VAECKDCRRPYGEYDYVNKCNGRDGETCLVAQAAYKRGLAAGVELAKKTARPEFIRDPYGTLTLAVQINWSETEDALRRGGGE
jgi:hypothetical protein